MKATLSFDLDSEEDKARHRLALKGEDSYQVILAIDEYLRNVLKYRDKFDTPEAEIQSIRDRLWEIRKDYGVDE